MKLEILDDYSVVVDGLFELDINRNLFNKLAFYKSAYERIDVIKEEDVEYLVVNDIKICQCPMDNLPKAIRCLFEELQEEIEVVEPKEERVDWIL